MIVMKFGGTSVEDWASIERVTEIIRKRVSLKPVVVVSAMGKTTRKLLNAAEASAAGDRNECLSLVAEVEDRHLTEAARLLGPATTRQAYRLIDQYFQELKKLLEGLAILGEVPPRGLDKILSYGELLSSAILTDALTDREVAATLLDSRNLIKTDGRFGNASPIFELTGANIRQAIEPVIGEGRVPVIQGFIGSTRDGATTTLGFEGSDYTATIVGAALGAADIQIWKDVPGLMTADPALFAVARTVRFCSFAEAAELTYFGAKVLHPKAIYPAARNEIPVHIYNSKNPEAGGTRISSESRPCSNLIKSIAYKRPVTLIHIRHDSAMEPFGDGSANEPGLTNIVDRLRRMGAAPLITSASGGNAVIAVEGLSIEKIQSDVFQSDSTEAGIHVEEHKAVISAVGENLRSEAVAAMLALDAAKNSETSLILYGSSPIAMHLVVAEERVEETISGLHELFFREADPGVFD